MRIYIFLLIFMFSVGSFAQGVKDRSKACYDNHFLGLSMEIDLVASDAVQEKLIPFLTKAFRESGRRFVASEIEFIFSRDKDLKTILDFEVLTADGQVYTFETELVSAYGEESGEVDLFEVSGVDNGVADSIGEIITTPTLVTCTGTKYFKPLIKVFNKKTSVFLGTIFLDVKEAGVFPNFTGSFMYAL